MAGTSSINFFVVAKEDLYLEGNTKRLLRISKGFSYTCQMLRTQQMVCLFRHFSKHHGLEKEDLDFSFVDMLRNEDTPESIHLMPHDQIYVERRRTIEDYDTSINTSFEKSLLSIDMLNLLRDPLHSDITFIVGEECKRITCHKAVICARSKYFANMFQPYSLQESRQNEVIISNYTSLSFTLMLEYLYTGDFEPDISTSLSKVNVDEVINLVLLADEFLLDSLMKVTSKCLCGLLKEDNLIMFMIMASKYNLVNLQEACIRYIRLNKSSLIKNQKFVMEMVNSPEIVVLILSALPEIEICNLESSNPNKRRRIVHRT